MEGNNIINTTPAGKVDAQKWLRFSEVLTLSLGAGLLLSGIIFFFAYNWETIHRFVKMGIVAALLLSTFVAVVKVPMRDWVRNITIFSMCILVGAFLALFGQIYQTGADSYTLFLSWAICIVVWVVVADFYPLWVFFIGLTMLAYGLSPFVKLGFTDFVVITSLFILFFEFSPKLIPHKSVAPKWFMTLLFSVAYTLAVIMISIVIFDGFDDIDGWDFSVSIAVSAATLFYAFMKRNLMLYSVFCIGVLTIIYELLIRIIDDWEMMIWVSIPFMAGIYFLGKHLINKKKEWDAIPSANQQTENQNND